MIRPHMSTLHWPFHRLGWSQVTSSLRVQSAQARVVRRPGIRRSWPARDEAVGPREQRLTAGSPPGKGLIAATYQKRGVGTR